ncbi:MAG: lipoate--protein ligase family protein [Pirellulaceae bacterium]
MDPAGGSDDLKSQLPTCRLVIDPPARGTWNMAVDEALLHAAARGVATLRLYQWSEPTLSLGYFQSCADRQDHVASRACPLVRRASGGGAILHDRELTYSIAVPIRLRFGEQAAHLYDVCHRSLIEALADLGVAAKLCAAPPAAGQQPFLCFQRQTRGDVLCAGAKIAGSAQRRHQAGLLQHGSILLGMSPRAPELPGIQELTAKPITGESLQTVWLPRLAANWGVEFQLQKWAEPESQQASLTEQARFAHADWTFRR